MTAATGVAEVTLKETHLWLDQVLMDWFLTPAHMLEEDQEFATSVRVALATDALADPNDVLPGLDDTDRRGWWGDLDAEAIWGGWPIGCKNWLLRRAKITEAPAIEGSTLNRAYHYTTIALTPFINLRMGSAVTVDARRTALDRIEVHATIFRGPRIEIDLRYQLLWPEGD